MGFFHGFTTPLWELFYGNLLLFACSLLYLAWWVLVFRSGTSGGTAGSVCLAAAFVTGIAAICLMTAAICSLAVRSKGLPVRAILIGAAVLYILLLAVTAMVFRRPVTSELLILHIWAAVELAAVAVLAGTGRFGPERAVPLVILVGAASAVGIVCYVLYYRLGGMAGYWDGMAPLAADALVMAAFLGVQTMS